MPTLHDDEFGDIVIRKNRRATHIRVSVAPDGSLRASMPFFSTQRGLKSLLDNSRTEIRTMLQRSGPSARYEDGMRVGKNHIILVSSGPTLSVTSARQRITLTKPQDIDIYKSDVQQLIRTEVRKVLRREARQYLPKRLEALARELDCHYERVRLSHASTRWGSCSSRGTISLNIALMQLPFELIDYVLIHELCHTKQMNHSPDFWQLVAAADPHFAHHRKTLKKHSPTI